MLKWKFYSNLKVLQNSVVYIREAGLNNYRELWSTIIYIKEADGDSSIW